MDALTAEIMRHLETLPLAKKQAVLELVKPAQNGDYAHGVLSKAISNTEQILLSLSQWDETSIAHLEEIHHWANEWSEQ